MFINIAQKGPTFFFKCYHVYSSINANINNSYKYFGKNTSLYSVINFRITTKT